MSLRHVRFCFLKSEYHPGTVHPASDNPVNKCWSDTPERSGAEGMMQKEQKKALPFILKEEKKMKKVNAKEYYKDFEITAMNWGERVIHISWKLPSRSIRSESCLYRHRDGSWHLDADSRVYGPDFARALSEAMAKFFLRSFCPAAKEYEYSGPSELARIERILLQEKQYRRAIEKKKKKEEEKPHRISAWHADEAV